MRTMTSRSARWPAAASGIRSSRARTRAADLGERARAERTVPAFRRAPRGSRVPLCRSRRIYHGPGLSHPPALRSDVSDQNFFVFWWSLACLSAFCRAPRTRRDMGFVARLFWACGREAACEASRGMHAHTDTTGKGAQRPVRRATAMASTRPSAGTRGSSPCRAARSPRSRRT